MHYVPKNHQNGLGFIGPETSGGYVTEGGAFTARRVYTPPQPAVITPTFHPDLAPIQTTRPAQTTYYDPSRTFTYSREQLQQMRDAAIASQGELLERQGRESGDGIYDDLEQKAAEENATEKAIAEGYGVPTATADAGSAQASKNVFPLILAAAAAYFFLV